MVHTVIFGSVRSSRNANVRSFVCLFDENLYVQSSQSSSFRLRSGLSLVSLLRFLYSLIQLSQNTLQVRRSLKYFVLFRYDWLQYCSIPYPILQPIWGQAIMIMTTLLTFLPFLKHIQSSLIKVSENHDNVVIQYLWFYTHSLTYSQQNVSTFTISSWIWIWINLDNLIFQIVVHCSCSLLPSS